MKKLKVVDLFCGAGGFSLGLKRAGLEVIKSLDYEPAALAVHSANLESSFASYWHREAIGLPWAKGQKRPPRRSTLSGTGRIVQWADLGDVLSYGPEMAALRPDVIVGGPPCQPFSRAGKQRGDGDWRSGLTEAFAMLVANCRPRYFIMENVPQIGESRAYKRARHIFAAQGYGITETELDSSFYGTPQARQRWICAGALDEANGWLQPYIEQYRSERQLTVADEFGPEFGVRLEDIVITGRERITKVEPEHYSDEGKHTRLKDRDVQFVLRAEPDERFYFCRPGGQQTGSIRSTMRPAPTITGKTTQGVGRNYAPREHDWIDLRKLPHPTFEQFSRLGGFPSDWLWEVPGYRTRLTTGRLIESKAPNQTEIRQMLGNAVAPPFAECLGRALIDHHQRIAPGERSSKSLREGTGKSWKSTPKKKFIAPDAYRDHLRDRGLTDKQITQELSNLARAKHEVARHQLTSSKDEIAALNSVLAVGLAPLRPSMKSSLRRAMREFATWEDVNARTTAERKRAKREAEMAKEDQRDMEIEQQERLLQGGTLMLIGLGRGNRRKEPA